MSATVEPLVSKYLKRGFAFYLGKTLRLSTNIEVHFGWQGFSC